METDVTLSFLYALALMISFYGIAMLAIGFFAVKFSSFLESKEGAE